MIISNPITQTQPSLVNIHFILSYTSSFNPKHTT